MTETATQDNKHADEVQQRGTFSRFMRLLVLVRPYPVRLFVATLFLLGASALGLAYPQLVREAVDTGMDASSVERLDYYALALVGIFLAQAGLTWVRHYLMSWLGERVVANLRKKVFGHLLKLDVGWYSERITGELVSRLASDVTTVQGAVGSELSLALRNFITFAGGISLLFVENWKLTLIMLAVVPPLTLGVVFFGRKIRKISKSVQDSLATTGGRVSEALGSIATVHVFGRERWEEARYAEGVEDAFEQARRLAIWRSWFMSTSGFAGMLGIAVIVWLGGRQVAAGELSAGDLTAFLLYTMMVAVSLASLTSIWSALQRAVGATERLFAIVDTEPVVKNPKTTVPTPTDSDLIFDNITYCYPNRPDELVLKNVSLSVDAGKTLALVGQSGSGKTTLASLVPRLRDPNSGRVCIGGQDIRELALDDLRELIAVVPQEPTLFAGSIAENIAYGRLEASRKEIEQAARDANAHEFISLFPEGYDTQVGERGVQLSGGQKQRIAIARAVVRKPEILILDEATSNLDSESEALVQAAIARVMKNHTTLIVAHRLSTIRDADEIAVLRRGQVQERGTHEDLMAKKGAYWGLVEHQLL